MTGGVIGAPVGPSEGGIGGVLRVFSAPLHTNHPQSGHTVGLQRPCRRVGLPPVLPSADGIWDGMYKISISW